ncbi:MAG: chromosomal replication initiator protein DnaA [Planctomycetes bacterium]|nr:chromosomal replication initiator protein DnaA [Planctomycetota bacterium]
MLPTDLVIVAPALWNDPARSFDNAAVWPGAGVAPTADRTETEPQFANQHAELETLLRTTIGAQSHQLWFRDKTVLTIRHDELIVRVASPFLSTWLQRQFREPLSSVATSVLGPAARVRFEIDASLAISSNSDADRVAGLFPQDETKATGPKLLGSTTPSANRAPNGTELSTMPRTEDAAKSATGSARRFADLTDFVAGSCNQLAFTAARQVCEVPGERLNPLYLFGGVGLGKTHLLEGIYCELRRRFPNWNIVFLTSEQFANYFTHALRSHTLPSFRQRFRGVDVLLVDDVDFLDGKRVIQEEFLHTVKTLESLGKQLIVTADRHPRLLSQTSEELSSRFVSGLVCRLEAPDLDTRTRIVQHKLMRRQLQVAPEAVSLISQWFCNNVRELEGALNCLEAHFAMNRQRVTGQSARQILADLQRDCIRIVRLSDVERVVCDLFRMIPDELRSSSRARHVSQPRMLAMFLARKLTQAAYSEIGEFFGGRNHSTVISAERQVQEWLTIDTSFTIAARQWSAGELLQTLEQQLLAS